MTDNNAPGRNGPRNPALLAVPFDPELAAVRAAFVAGMPLPVTPDSIGELRQVDEENFSSSDEELALGGKYSVFERHVPGPAGAPDIVLLMCAPKSAKKPAGAIYHIHGGGMISGNRRVGIDLVLDLAAQHEMTVVSVEYRLAPEHPDPAPVEDCYAGLVWTVEHAGEVGLDPDRIVIAGPSAGGGLAAGTTLLARDSGGPEILGQMLLTPMLDDRNDTVSALQMRDTATWDLVPNQTGWAALLGDRQSGPDVSQYAAPARAEDLSGLPPTFIDVGSADTFRDEAITFATRVWHAGGCAELHVWQGG